MVAARASNDWIVVVVKQCALAVTVTGGVIVGGESVTCPVSPVRPAPGGVAEGSLLRKTKAPGTGPPDMALSTVTVSEPWMVPPESPPPTLSAVLAYWYASGTVIVSAP